MADDGNTSAQDSHDTSNRESVAERIKGYAAHKDFKLLRTDDDSLLFRNPMNGGEIIVRGPDWEMPMFLITWPPELGNTPRRIKGVEPLIEYLKERPDRAFPTDTNVGMIGRNDEWGGIGQGFKLKR
jgi:hypothetical protein